MSKKEELLALIKRNDYRGMDVKQLSRMIQMEDSVAFTELMKLLTIWKLHVLLPEMSDIAISLVKN